jgi:hypothetical protein
MYAQKKSTAYYLQLSSHPKAKWSVVVQYAKGSVFSAKIYDARC